MGVRGQGVTPTYISVILIFFQFLEDISPFVGPLIPLFRTSGDISSGFQSQSGQPYFHLVEAYVLHLP